MRDARTLDAGTLQRLGAAGKRIADQERGARDIEWAIQGGTLFILQARPVTSKGSAPRVEISGGHRIVWDNSNIQESYFGVTTPLTFSFASAAYASVYEQTMRALGIPERVIATHRSMLANLLGLIRGRVYYNLNNWYRGLLLLPAFHRNKRDMERMMGVEEPVDFVEDKAPSALARVRRTPRLLSTMARMVARFATLPTNSACFLEEVDTTLGSIDRDALAGRPLAELMWLLDRLRRECIDRWTTPIVNDFYVMTTTGKLRRLVARALPREVENVMQVLLGGADVATSSGPAMMLLRMAELARGDPTLAHVLRTREGADALNAARDTNADFAATYAALVHRFGDRCMGELKLESRPLRDDPRFVLRMLRNYLETTPPNSDALAARAWAERQRVEWRVAGNLGILSRRRFHRALNAARRGIRMREEMRLARTRLFGVHRDIYKAIGARLHASGRLATPHDVFYLTTTEIEAYWEGTAVSTDLASIAAARRREFAAYATLPAPNRIVTEGAPADGLTSDGALAMTSATVADGMVLHGLGCSPGIAEGPVRIITSPTDELTLAGHILVAPRTDPGWAPLFPSAAAIVVERGSLLSHSAVLARELGLPAVVSIPGVVGLLRDGERVRVDGTRGTVERLEATCAS